MRYVASLVIAAATYGKSAVWVEKRIIVSLRTLPPLKADGFLRREASAEMHTLTGQTVTTRKVLHSWKDISNYTGRGIRTIQRYEARFGLPIHRVAGTPRSAVLAFSDEIDAWFSKAPTAAPVPLVVPPPAVTAKQLSERREWLAVAANAKRSRESAAAAYQMCKLQAKRVQEMIERFDAVRSRLHAPNLQHRVAQQILVEQQ